MNGGRGIGLRQHAEPGVGAELGHEKGRHYALAGHVPHQDGQTLSRQRNEVVIIAADLIGRLIVGNKLIARDFGQPPRQQAALHPAGQLQVELEPLTCQFQVATVFLQFDLQAAKLQVRLDAGVQLFHLKRLGEVIHPADGKGFHLVQLLGERADEDDGNPLELIICFEALAHFVAVHLRHIDVQQDQVRGIAPCRQQGQFAARNGADFIAAVLEHAGQHLEIGVGVVHHQDAGRLPGTTFWLLRIHGRLPTRLDAVREGSPGPNKSSSFWYSKRSARRRRP